MTASQTTPLIPSQACIDIVKKFEGCRLDSYLCPAQVPTIGYGHTVGVKLGETITQSDADRILTLDLQEFGRCVGQMVKVSLTQPQFDALVSLAFNIGVGALQKSTLLKFVNQSDFAAAAAEFSKWDKVKKKPLIGLTLRRAAERELFESIA